MSYTDANTDPADRDEVMRAGSPIAESAPDEPVTCSRCGAVYDEATGDGYCGLCPECADATEPCTWCGQAPCRCDYDYEVHRERQLFGD